MIPGIFFILATSLFVWVLHVRIQSGIQIHEEFRQKMRNQYAAIMEKECQQRLETMRLRLAEEARQEQARIWNRIMELSEKFNPTLDERRELAWMKAEQTHHGECSSMPSYLESPSILWDHTGVAPIPLPLQQPFLERDWVAAEHRSKTANVGTIFHLASSALIGRPFRYATHILVRTDQICPWERMIIVHEQGSNIQDIIHQHLYKKSWSTVWTRASIISSVPSAARWDSELNEWYLPESI